MRLIDFVSLNSRLKDLLGPVTRVKKKTQRDQERALNEELEQLREEVTPTPCTPSPEP